MTALRRAVIVGVALAAGSVGPALAPAATPHRLAVARVTKVTGAHRFYVRRGAHLRRLHVGSRISVRDLLVLGPSTRARLTLLLSPRSSLSDTAYALYVDRFHGTRIPSARRVTRQFGLSGFAAKNRRYVLIEPRYLEVG